MTSNVTACALIPFCKIVLVTAFTMLVVFGWDVVVGRVVFLKAPCVRERLRLSLRSFGSVHVVRRRVGSDGGPILCLCYNSYRRSGGGCSAAFLGRLIRGRLILPIIGSPGLFGTCVPRRLNPVGTVVIPSRGRMGGLGGEILR